MKATVYGSSHCIAACAHQARMWACCRSGKRRSPCCAANGAQQTVVALPDTVWNETLESPSLATRTWRRAVLANRTLTLGLLELSYDLFRKLGDSNLVRQPANASATVRASLWRRTWSMKGLQTLTDILDRVSRPSEVAQGLQTPPGTPDRVWRPLGFAQGMLRIERQTCVALTKLEWNENF